jgi:hypothetical protein
MAPPLPLFVPLEQASNVLSETDRPVLLDRALLSS